MYICALAQRNRVEILKGLMSQLGEIPLHSKAHLVIPFLPPIQRKISSPLQSLPT